MLWRTGVLLGVPFDMVEYSLYRSWQPPRHPSEEEQEAVETRIDQDLLPAYRVDAIYPSSDRP